jgi:hypothetical protein
MDCLTHILALALHSQGGFNTVVPGAGVFCRHGAEDAWIAGAGAYANSEKAVERKVSQYAFGGWQPFKLGDLRAGGMVGLVNGYSYNSGKTIPMAAAVLSYPLPRPFAEAHLTVIPPVRGVTPAVAQLSFTLRF